MKAAGAAGTVGIAGAIGLRYRRRTPSPESDDESPPETSEPDGSTREPEPEIPYADAYSTVIRATEHGVDSNASEPIDSFLQEFAGNDTLLAFPEGTFSISAGVVGGYEHFGIIGTGSGRSKLVPSDGNCVNDGPFLSFEKVQDLLFDGFTFDFRNSSGGGSIHFRTHGDVTVRDVSVVGNCENQISVLRIDALSRDGTFEFERFTARNTNGNDTLTGVYVGDSHAGDVVFKDCELQGFSDNGLYASSPGLRDGKNGTVRVEGGEYRNNNISNIRLGSTESVARNVDIVSTEPPNAEVINVRGIRFRDRQDQLFEDSRIRIGPNSGDGFGAVVFHPENLGATVKNTDIVVDRDDYNAIFALRAIEPSNSGPVFENVSISGEASGEFVGRIEGRTGTIFRGCTIEGTGENRDGLRFANAENTRIENCRIAVTGDPIVLRQSTATIVDTTIEYPDGETEHIEQMEATDEDFTPR